MASTTLTWQNSGLGAKTGTTDVLFLTDLNTLITSYAGNAAFSWQVSGTNLTTPNTATSGSPYYILLSRKSADPDMPIATFGSITAGSGYVNGTYNGVALTGGKGSAATANITVAGGVVTACTLVNPGDGYVVADALSCPNTSLGGSGSGFSIPVATTSTAGRLLIFSYAVIPTYYNTNLMDQVPPINTLYCVWFPEGTGTAPTASALVPTAAIGAFTTMTVDTNSGKVTALPTSSAYAAGYQPFYFDSPDAIWIFMQNPGSTGQWGFAGGLILVDFNDVPYDGYCAFPQACSTGIFAGTWAPSVAAGSNTAGADIVRAPTYGGGRSLYGAYGAPVWAQQIPGVVNDITVNPSTQSVNFFPIPLMSLTKNEGIVLKIRQVALGPNTPGQFAIYYTSGPAISAQAAQSQTGAANTGTYWMTNFKV